MTLLVPLLHLLVLFTAFIYADHSYSPIVALRPRHLVAFYPLLSDSRDYAPYGTTNGYTQDGNTRSTITPKLGARLEQGTGLDFPVNIHRRSFPQLTIGAWVQASEAMAVNRGCLLSQDGSNVGRAICVDRGKWTVGGHVQDGVAVNIDDWSFVAAVFDENSTKFFVNGELMEINVVVASLASPLLVVGAAEDQPLTGFTGYLKSVFMFDVALSETELNYLMTTKGVVAEDTEVTPVSTPVSDLVVKVKPTPHLYLKDRLENSVSARQVIDPDADEYNAALPILDDSEFLSVELVYAVDIFDDESSTVDNIAFTLWSLEPKHRALQVGSIVTVQGSPSFDSLASTCRINDDTNISPFKNFSPASQVARLTLHNEILLENASVMAGPATGGTSVDITGKFFVSSTDVACRFGESRSRAYFVSDTVVRCISPAWTPVIATEGIAPVPIRIALNGLDFSSSSLSFQYYAPPVADTISPVNVPVNTLSPELWKMVVEWFSAISSVSL
ncbi:hypothetical protein PC119_g2404 [Phytophthora cactorum]|nr:hypothetical protein PC119_g2404 [Phytophthora cactorum]